MRKTVVFIALIAALVGVLPTTSAVAADRIVQPNTPFVFPVADTVPCGVGVIGVADACPYNTAGDLAGFSACENPPPPEANGSRPPVKFHADVVTVPAPLPASGYRVVLQLQANPNIDWDTFICKYKSPTDHNGELLTQGANTFAEPCDNLVGPSNLVPIGCKEVAMAPAVTGQRYVLRAYNWLDVTDCPAIYKWVFVHV